MRVALLGPMWGRPNGWSRVVENIAPLIARYYDTTLYLPIDSPRRKSSHNLNVKYLLPSLAYNPFHPSCYRLLMKSLSELKRGNYDLIQTLEAWPLSVVGALASKFTQLPLIIGAHGTAAIEPLFRTSSRIPLIWSYRNSEIVLCISSYTKNELEKLTGLGKFIVHPLDGVNYELFSKPRDLSDLERKWRPGKILLTVCNLKKRKGLDISIKAFKYVKAEFKDAKYLIIGTGNPEPYKQLAYKLGIKDVYFLGAVSDEELARYYQLCDVYVMTPKRAGVMDVEGFGLVYLEAGAAGKPVVASAHGGVPDVVKHMVNGILVPENDYKSTAEAILKILRDEELARKLGNNGRRLARLFTWENIVKSLMKIWKKILR